MFLRYSTSFLLKNKVACNSLLKTKKSISQFIKCINGQNSCQIYGNKVVAYNFSNKKNDNQNQSMNQDNKNNAGSILRQTKQKQAQIQQPELIQVSKQQYERLKKLLAQMKSQLQNLQKGQIKDHTKSDNLISHKIQQKSTINQTISLNSKIKNSSKLLDQIKSFSKLSKFTRLEQVNNKQQQQQNLFFKSQQQRLSFQLIKMNVKQQFTQLIDYYMNFCTKIQNKIVLGSQQNKYNDQTTIKNKQNQLQQAVKLLYLILFRYTSLENGKFYDNSIQQLVLKVTQYVHLLDEMQVQKLLSIMVDQIKESQKANTLDQYKNLRQHGYFPNTKMGIKEFISNVKKNLLFDNKILNFKNKSNKNSEIITLMNQFFDKQQLKGIQKFLQLNQYSKKSNNKSKLILYNPLNLSHLINSNTPTNDKSSLLRMFEFSLSLSEQQFLERQIKVKETQKFNANNQAKMKQFEIQQSLAKITTSQFKQLQYEAIVYFLQSLSILNQQSANYNDTMRIIQSQCLNNTRRFNYIQELRILYSFLIKPQMFSKLLISQALQKITKVLFQLQRNDLSFITHQQDNIQDLQYQNSNIQFINYKKFSMMVNQLGIQLYKYYRIHLKSQQVKNAQLIEQLSFIVDRILILLIKACIQKIQLNDMFKQEQENMVEKNVYKLIMNLNVFQFTVNFNILNKLAVQLTKDPTKQLYSIELLNGLIKCFFGNLKANINEQIYSSLDAQKMMIAQQLVIMILIGKQNEITSKTIDFYLKQSQKSQQIIELLRKTIGKNIEHKYFNQYKKISQQYQ